MRLHSTIRLLQVNDFKNLIIVCIFRMSIIIDTLISLLFLANQKYFHRQWNQLIFYKSWLSMQAAHTLESYRYHLRQTQGYISCIQVHRGKQASLKRHTFSVQSSFRKQIIFLSTTGSCCQNVKGILQKKVISKTTCSASETYAALVLKNKSWMSVHGISLLYRY